MDLRRRQSEVGSYTSDPYINSKSDLTSYNCSILLQRRSSGSLIEINIL
jgi:hypothetical protein